MDLVVYTALLLLSLGSCQRVLDLHNIGIPVSIDLDQDTHVQSHILEILKSNSDAVVGIFKDTKLRFQHDLAHSSELSRRLARYKSGPVGDINDCMNDTTYVLENIMNVNQTDLQTAAISYLDAASKIPDGILSGKWLWTGDYDECQNIQRLLNPYTKKYFEGSYITSALYVNGKPLVGQYPVMLGFCLPDSCKEAEAKFLLNTGLAYLKSQVPQLKNVTITAVSATANTQPDLDAGATTFLVITAILCFILLLATIMDYVFSEEERTETDQGNIAYDEPCDNNDRTGLLSDELYTNNIQGTKFQLPILNGKLMEFCKAFSILSNGKKLFSTKTADGPLACLNGMRVLSMWWVILGHTFAFVISFVNNTTELLNVVGRFSFQPIVNGTYSVDTFFFLSGLLVAYLAFKQLKETNSLNAFYYIAHRYWRLTPLYAFVIFYYAYVMIYTVNGPLQFILRSDQYIETLNLCKTYWWSNLLYINNMYPNYGGLATTCLGWGWYLANDMQFYIVLGPIVIATLWWKKYLGIVVTSVFILACIITRAGLVAYFGIYDELSGTPTKHMDNKWAMNGTLYQRPYARWSVYLVGMLVGYALAMTNNRIKIPRLLALVGWCVATACALAVIYGQYYYNHHIAEQAHMTLTASGFYVSLGRTVWGCCLAWVVIACVSGNGGLVKDILSWKVWAPLGRLTYAAYLVHPIVMYTYLFNLSESYHYTDMSIIYMFISHLVVSYGFAFLLSMLVEAPMIQLEKLLLIPLGKQLYAWCPSISQRVRRRREDTL